MTFLHLEYAGLYLVHWFLSVFIPLLMIIFTMIHLIVGWVLFRRISREISTLTANIEDLQGRSINHLSAVDRFFNNCGMPAIRSAFTRMRQDARDLYQDRWLPNPDRDLDSRKLLRPSQKWHLSYGPAAFLFAVGTLGSTIALLVRHGFPAPDGLAAGLILLPVLTSLSCAVLTTFGAHHFSMLLKTALTQLKFSLERHLPVFDDQAGLALLIDNFSEYDRQMNGSLQKFTETASRLAESDMADGIRRSVEQVLLDSVAPSIQRASGALGSLAGELASRQERGMQDLAARFASALSSEIASNLQPVNREIAQMGTLMSDVRNYIEYAMRALETTRQQSEGLLADTKDAMQQIGEARVQLTEDFSQVDRKLQQMVVSTSELATLYQGNEQSLSNHIKHLNVQFEQYIRHLGTMINTAVSSMQDARTAAESQQVSAGQYLAAMQDQVNQLTGHLKEDIDYLLKVIHEESAVIAGQAGDIGKQVGMLSSALDQSLGDFTRVSAQYVQKTLASLDGSLAELAGRIAGTAAELRDAVDALPDALRHASAKPDEK